MLHELLFFSVRSDLQMYFQAWWRDPFFIMMVYKDLFTLIESHEAPMCSMHGLPVQFILIFEFRGVSSCCKLDLACCKHCWNNDCGAELIQCYFQIMWSITPCSGMCCELILRRGPPLTIACSLHFAPVTSYIKENIFLLTLKPEKYLILDTNPVVLILPFSACYWLK